MIKILPALDKDQPRKNTMPKTKNNNKTANQASKQNPMPSCLAHIKAKEKKRLELFTVL